VKLPNYDNAIVPREKIVDYLLSLAHRDGRSKAIFFFSFGFSIETWQTLADALRHHAAAHEVAKIESTPFGARYVVEGELAAPDGRTPLVRVVWFVDTGEDVPRLATAYPL
jgi:hypothetical protein